MFAQKSVLARLLANENITVQQGNYQTAYFDVEKRVLGLPLWKEMSKDVFDMLVGHEVSHALFTPQDFHLRDNAKGIPHSWLNVVEDVRIEKLILRKYPGLVGNFKRGYTELMLGESDLFGIKDKDLSGLGFMDRLNIHAKARDLIEVPFADDELPYVAKVKACETYDEVIDVCLEIQAWLKEKAEQQQQEGEGQPEQGDGSDGEGENTVTVGIITDDEGDEGAEASTEKPDIIIDARENKGESDESDEGESDESDDSEGGEGASSEPESGLADQEAMSDLAFGQNASSLVEKGTTYAVGMTRDYAYASVVPYEKIAEGRRRAIERMKNRSSFYYSASPDFPDAKYSEFLTETKRVVNLMVKEFEMRKAAWRSLRARESTKGTIDVNKLHKYQYDDMLFKQVSHLADAKNHGLVMMIDYSGSMYQVLPNVIRQTLTLLMFCKRVGIPFEVYSFTSMGGGDAWASVSEAKRKATPSVTHINADELSLLKLFDSSMSKRDYDEAFRNMFWYTEDNYVASEFEALGNTPLNTALMAMQYIISDFRAKHRVQKMSFVSLTDGDSNPLYVKHGVDGGVRSYDTSVDVNGKIIKVRQSGYGEAGRKATEAFTKAISDMGVTTLNYFIVNRPRDLNYELERSLGAHRTSDAVKSNRRAVTKDGVAVLDNNRGYDRRFILLADKMGETIEDLEVDADATVSKLAKAFTKSNGSKKRSKLITQKFAELVA